MSGFQITINISGSDLDETSREVILTGIAASTATLLADYYSTISVVPEDTFAIDDAGVSAHEITGTVSSPY